MTRGTRTDFFRRARDFVSQTLLYGLVNQFVQRYLQLGRMAFKLRHESVIQLNSQSPGVARHSAVRHPDSSGLGLI